MRSAGSPSAGLPDQLTASTTANRSVVLMGRSLAIGCSDDGDLCLTHLGGSCPANTGVRISCSVRRYAHHAIVGCIAPRTTTVSTSRKEVHRMGVKWLTGDCRVTLATLEAGSCQIAVTSPPY
jgi:hypothetical protein